MPSLNPDKNTYNLKHTRVSYTYDLDDTGAILGTYPKAGLDASYDIILPPMYKPKLPKEIDTPEKRAQWDAYWDKTLGWWASERDNEKRMKW